MSEWAVEEISIDRIKEYDNNAKIHTDDQIEKIKLSIESFGYADPIALDENNVIIEGHGRLKALKLLGYDKVKIIRLEGLTDEQKNAYRVAHNELTMLTGFNNPVLKKEFIKHKDLLSKYFPKHEARELRRERGLRGGGKLEASKEHTPYSQYGDLWILGEHKLACGDNADNEIYDLLEIDEIDLIQTDPPYNVGYEGGRHRERRKIQNDKLSDDNFVEFLNNSLKRPMQDLKEGGVFYIWTSCINIHLFRKVVDEYDINVSTTVFWLKDHYPVSRGDYSNLLEPCIYGWKKGAKHYFIPSLKETTLFDRKNYLHYTQDELIAEIKRLYEDLRANIFLEKKEAKNKIHPTVKPLSVITKQITNSTKEGETVLDMFSGGGTTLIACDDSGRIFRGIELDPVYIDKTVRRYVENLGDAEPDVKLVRDGKEYKLNEIKKDMAVFEIESEGETE